MGYYSKFTLSWKTPEGYNDEYREFVTECRKKKIKIPNKVSATVDKMTELEDALNSDNSCSYGHLFQMVNGSDQIKWYNHEDEMRAFSKKFPEILFILEVNGEEEGDLSIKYFKNGKMQRADAVITYAEFDESKLG